MNKVILMGRLTREPEERVAGNGSDGLVIARFTLAVDRRRTSQDGQREADFISCVAFGKVAEFVQRYLHTGTKIAVNGRIQTGSYVKQDGQKVYTTEVVADEIEFAESKAAADVRFGNQQRDGYQGRPQYPNPTPIPTQYPYQNPNQVQYPNQNPYQGQSAMAPGAPQVPQYGQYREAPVNQGFMQQSIPQMPVQDPVPKAAPQVPSEGTPVRVPEVPVMPAPETVAETRCEEGAEAETKAGTEPAAAEKFMPAPEEKVSEEAVQEQEPPEEIETGSEVGQGFMNIVEGVEDESLPFN